MCGKLQINEFTNCHKCTSLNKHNISCKTKHGKTADRQSQSTTENENWVTIVFSHCVRLQIYQSWHITSKWRRIDITLTLCTAGLLYIV